MQEENNPLTTTTSDTISYLRKLANYAKINLDEVLNSDKSMKEIKKNLEKIILENHQYEIYYSNSEHCWRTYLPDETSPRKRRSLKRKDINLLKQAIVQFYVNKQEANDSSKVLLKELYERWMVYRRDYTPAKPKTIYENSMEWKKFFEGTDLANTPVTEIKPITIIRFFRALTKNRDISYKRISNARSVLNGIFTYAVEEEIITHNPVLDVNFKSFVYKPIEDQSDNVYSEEDAKKLLFYLSDINEPYALAIQLSFYLFIRVGETKAIRIEDIDFKNRTVYLHAQALTERTLNDDLTFSSRTVTVVNQMKGNTSRGFRKQHLTNEALYIIHKALLLNPNGEYLFEPNGSIMTTDRFNRRLKAYCEACGVIYHSSHKIRFYNCSTAYDGKNLSVLSKLMGHSQISTTMHYLRNVDKGTDSIDAFMSLGLTAK